MLFFSIDNITNGIYMSFDNFKWLSKIIQFQYGIFKIKNQYI